ncbi:NADH-quinone oxidoreductase subunit NuoE [Chloroflexota bacterium]
MQKELAEVLSPYKGQRGATIPVLQKAQQEIGYLREDTISEVAEFLGMTKSEVYGVATFYAQFRFERQGEHTIKCCQGTACYVQGGRRILEAVEDELNLAPGKTTTEDYKFSVEQVACFGSCALAPVMVVDKTVYGRLTPAKAREIIAQY